MRTILFIFCFVLFIVGSIAFKAPVANCNLLVKDSLKVTKELKQIKDFDQTYRTRYYLSYRDSFQYLKDSIESLQEVIDRKNHIKLTALINKYSYNCLAAKYYGCFFASIFSHMPDDIMQSYYQPKVLEAVKAKIKKPYDYAALVDWMYFRRGDNQMYGTYQCGHKVLCVMQDRKNINKIRAEIGLESIEEYCRKNNFTMPD